MNQAAKSYEPAKCAWCDGSGKGKIAPGIIGSCIVCGGKGHISIAQPAGSCPECQGSGRRNIDRLCFNCAGTGWKHISGAIV